MITVPPTDEAQHLVEPIIWWEEITKKSGLFKSGQKRLLVLPGRVSYISTDITDRSAQIQKALQSEKAFPITPDLKVNQQSSAKVVQFEVPVPSPAAGGKLKYETISFQCATAEVAASLVSEVKLELNRDYLSSPNFTPDFKEQLNATIRAQIFSSAQRKGGHNNSSGDNAALTRLFYSCLNGPESSPMELVETLFTNYRSIIRGSDPTATSFLRLLSAAANDPVILVLYLCCEIELQPTATDGSGGNKINVDGKSSSNSSNKSSGSSIEDFDAQLDMICSAVSSATWQSKRTLLLAQFAFPDATSRIDSLAVLRWSDRYTSSNNNSTNSSKRFCISPPMLQRLLEDDKYLCYACLKHHADTGDTEMAQKAFATAVPHVFLLATFRIVQQENAQQRGGSRARGRVSSVISSNSSKSSTPTAVADAEKPYFVDFLFHPNLKHGDVFLSILNAFQAGSGYNNEFFHSFLTEALARGEMPVAVKVLSTILFDSATAATTADGNSAVGQAQVRALKFCPQIEVIIFNALATTAKAITDDTRLLIEICLRLEYFALDMKLKYLQTLSQQIDAEENNDESSGTALRFNSLLERADFSSYLIAMCKHNLDGHNNSLSSSSNSERGSVFFNASERGSYSPKENHPLPTASPLSYSNATAATATAAHAVLATAADANNFYDAGRASPLASPVAGAVAATSSETSSLSSLRQAAVATVAVEHIEDAPITSSDNNSSSVRGGRSGGNRKMSATSTWLDRSAENITAVVYAFIVLLIRSNPLPSELANDNNSSDAEVAAVQQPVLLQRFFSLVPTTFYSILLVPGSPLRVQLSAYLKYSFNILASYNNLVDSSSFFCRAEHFSYSVLFSLSYNAHHITDLMPLLIEAALKMHEFDGLFFKFKDMDESIGCSQEQQHQLELILDCICSRDECDFIAPATAAAVVTTTATGALQYSYCSLSHVSYFTRCATTMVEAARRNGENAKLLADEIERILRDAPVCDWVTEFSTRSGIAPPAVNATTAAAISAAIAAAAAAAVVSAPTSPTDVTADNSSAAVSRSSASEGEDEIASPLLKLSPTPAVSPLAAAAATVAKEEAVRPPTAAYSGAWENLVRPNSLDVPSAPAATTTTAAEVATSPTESTDNPLSPNSASADTAVVVPNGEELEEDEHGLMQLNFVGSP